MVRTSLVIGALAIAAMATISAPQPSGALPLRGGQTELINRPDSRHQHCWADSGHGRWHSCEGGSGFN
jgi:hypothetical protein